MAEFSVGQKVIHVDTKEKGVILEVIPCGRARINYNVKWGTRENEEMEADLMPDFDVSNPFERSQKHMFGSYSDYVKKNTTFKIQNSNNSTISSLKASKTLFRPYQFKPLLKFLNSPFHRLLVADEVGLGKTIEAGHILLEMKARNELKHALIVCSKSLQKKWQEELQNRFGLTFRIFKNGDELQDAFKEVSNNVRGIVTYDTIRAPKEVDEDDLTEEELIAYRNRKHKLVEYLEESDIRFSMVICDEAHQLRNAETLRYKGATVVMDRADAAVFLTATPVMLGTSDLYNQLHLLNSSAYYNYQVFDNMLRENAPFVRAITELSNNAPLNQIEEHLRGSVVSTRYMREDVLLSSFEKTVDERFADYPIYQRIIETLDKQEDNASIRAKLFMDLSSMSVMNNIFSRTRKKDVTTDFSQPERKPHLIPIRLSTVEQREFDSVVDQYYEDNTVENEWGEEELKKGAALGLIQKKRQISSSIFAYLNDEEDLDRGIDIFKSETDAKFEMLVKIMSEVFKGGTKKLIIFAVFRKTLKYLKLRFHERGINCLMIHGQTKDRFEILKDFKNDDGVHVLLSSEVGSEGLDMQFCNAMVNYDLPWNPMVVEQRIGRIDRFGQQAQVVNIYNMVVEDSIQEQIYERLLMRIGIFHNTIGDMEAILDAEYEGHGDNAITIKEMYKRLEKELYTVHLTPEQQKRKIDEVAQAICKEEENLKSLENDMTNTLTNDSYFKNEINRILHNNAYVTEDELINYMEKCVQENLSYCKIVSNHDGTYTLNIPKSYPKCLTEFLLHNEPSDDENRYLFKSFRNSIMGKLQLHVTFRQELAYENRDLIFLNMYNPLIQAASNQFNKDEDNIQSTFSFALESDDLLQKGKQYFLAVYVFTITQRIQGRLTSMSNLVPLAYDVDDGELVMDKDVTERIFGKSQCKGKDRNVKTGAITDELIQEMRGDMKEYISRQRKNQKNELMIQSDNNRMRDKAQLQEWYESQKKTREESVRMKTWELDWLQNSQYSTEDAIKKKQRSLKSAKGQLTRLEKDYAEKISMVDVDPEINVEDTLISLNFIAIE